MTHHPDAGTLQAYLDGEIQSEAREALDRHLEGCPACRETLRDLDRLARTAREALAGLQVPAPDPDRARRALRRRRTARRTAARSRYLALAASVLLLFGVGLAAAIPDSPLRLWWAERGGEPPAPAALPPEGEPPGEPEPPPEEAGLALDPREGAVSVSFHAVEPGAWLEVREVEGQRAGVFAPAGARFDTGAGRVSVRVEGGGLLRVELPRTAPEVEIRVNGELLLLREGGALRYPGPPPADTAGGVVRIRVPGDGEGVSAGTSPARTG